MTLTSQQVALKNIIDALSHYAIEECLLGPLHDIFTPDSVYCLDDNIITRIAGESEQTTMERESLAKKLTILNDTQKILRRMDRQKPTGTIMNPFNSGLNTNCYSLIEIEELDSGNVSLVPKIRTDEQAETALP
jgi:hypothetical protein